MAYGVELNNDNLKLSFLIENILKILIIFAPQSHHATNFNHNFYNNFKICKKRMLTKII